MASVSSDIQAEDRQIAQWFQEGQRSLDQNDAKQASQFFMQILQQQPMYPLAKIYLSRCYYNLGLAALTSNNLKDAQAYFINAIEADGQNGEAHYNLGVIYDTLAGKHFEAAGGINSDDPDTLTQLGIRLGEQGHYEEAANLLLKVLSLQPSDQTSHYNLAVLYIQQQKYWKAIEEFQWLLRADGSQQAIYNSLSFAYLQVDELEKALDTYQRLLNINPINIDGLKGAGLVALKLNKIAIARSYLEQYLIRVPNDTQIQTIEKTLR
jgi:tetratricopeptide (TPR) repeat protein